MQFKTSGEGPFIIGFKSSPGYDTVQPFENPWSEQFVSILPDSLVGKESACNAGDPGLILGSGRSTGEGIGSHSIFLGFPGGLVSKESTCNVEDLGLISGLGRSPGGGHDNPLQYSCLENLHGQKILAGYSPRGQKESDMLSD